MDRKYRLESPLPLPRWLLLPLLSLFFLGLVGFPIYIVDEARNAQAAWEMLQRADWITPTFNEGLRTDKPPLHYWLMRPFYVLFGKSALAARLPSALCGAITTLAVYGFTRRFTDHQRGLLASVVYALGLYVPVQFSLATPDPYLALCFTGGMFALYIGFVERRSRWLYAGYLLLGLGALAKGPISFVLAGLGWLLFLVLYHRRSFFTDLWRLRPLRGALLALLVATPWFLAVHWRTDGAFTEDFFLHHNLQRFAETKEGHGGTPFLVPLIALGALLPFSWWGFRACWRPTNAAVRFCVATALSILLFFAFSQTKLPSYPFPSLAFLAVAIGVYGGKFFSRSWAGTRGDGIAFFLTLIVLVGLPIGAYFGLRQDRVLSSLAADWWHLCFLWPVAILAAYGWWNRRPQRALATIAVGWFAFQVYALIYLLPAIGRFSQIPASAELLRAAPDFAAVGRFQPAYVFTLDRPILRLEDRAEVTEWLRTAPDSALLLTAARYDTLLPPQAELMQVFEQKDLFEYPTTKIYRYRAPN